MVGYAEGRVVVWKVGKCLVRPPLSGTVAPGQAAASLTMSRACLGRMVAHGGGTGGWEVVGVQSSPLGRK